MSEDVEGVAVLGAGVMGVGISQVFLDAGIPVAVHDPSTRARASFPHRLEASRIATGSVLADSSAASVHSELGDAVRAADLVIEAGPERLDVKQQVFVDVERLARAGAILASNTSSIPIGEVSARIASRERVLGAHFWNPPSIVRLVEVVRAADTDPRVAARLMQVLGAMGMVPVLVEADIPGFVGNRLQHALKREAIALVAAGVCTAETVDLVVREGFGSRLGIVGPLEQSDLSGTDLTLAIHEVLMPHLDRTPHPHPYLVEMVERGDLGASTGQGFRAWATGEADRRRTEIANALVEDARRRAERERSHD
jgi:3-hydroxybutyryl-CoA dehydrogenase